MDEFGMKENEKQAMREELELYLKEFKEKKDEDGKPLIFFPSNFDLISLSMNRKDLKNNENK